jgi:hypothetical protein
VDSPEGRRLLPGLAHALRSRATSRNSESVAHEPRLVTWRTSARMMAELLTGRPRTVEASRLNCWRASTTSGVKASTANAGSFGTAVVLSLMRRNYILSHGAEVEPYRPTAEIHVK